MKVILKTLLLAIIVAFLASCERQVILNSPEIQSENTSKLQTKSTKLDFDKRLFNEWFHDDKEEKRIYKLHFHQYTDVLEITRDKDTLDTYKIWAAGDGKLKLVDQEDGVLEEWDYYFDEDLKGKLILFSKNVNEKRWLKHQLDKPKKWWNKFKLKDMNEE